MARKAKRKQRPTTAADDDGGDNNETSKRGRTSTSTREVIDDDGMVVEASTGAGNGETSDAAGSDAPSGISILQSRNINRAGRPAEAGIIRQVYVENFMCHRKLTVNLIRNVNFINGQNGSG